MSFFGVIYWWGNSQWASLVLFIDEGNNQWGFFGCRGKEGQAIRAC